MRSLSYKPSSFYLDKLLEQARQIDGSVYDDGVFSRCQPNSESSTGVHIDITTYYETFRRSEIILNLYYAM